MSRKLPRNLECPVDNILMDIAETLSPLFYKIGFTANGITTLSLISGLFSVYFVYVRKYKLGGIFWLLQYFFDDMDGLYARKYNMVTKIGDTYDHVKDALVYILIIIVFFLQKKYSGIVLLFVSLLFINCIMGCQEFYYDKDESPALTITKQICPCKNRNDSIRILPYLRWFGVGTWNLIIAIYIFFQK